MTPEDFLREFGDLMVGPSGLAQLRHLAMRLAVTGRLSPASTTWRSETLGDVCVVLDSQRRPVNASEREKRTVGKAQSSLYPYYGATQQQGWIDDYLFDEDLVLLGEDGVPFLDPLRPKAYLVRGKSWVNNHAHVLRAKATTPEFLVLCLNTTDYSSAVAGTTRLKLTQGKMLPIPLAYPPLPEQKRIVEKVDQLMALCDDLEAAQKKRRETSFVTNKAILSAVTSASGTKELKESWKRVQDNFEVLYDAPENVQELRQTILQLAVIGKLVRQDARDEGPQAVLKEVATKRDALLAARKASRWEGASTAKAAHSIPSRWVWVPFGATTICRDLQRVPVSRTEREKRRGQYDYYGASGVIDTIDDYIFSEPLLLIGEDGANLINRSTPIAFLATGKYWVNNHAHVLDGACVEHLCYLAVFINATDLRPYVTGTAQPKMNQEKMNSIPVALPPLAEQKRIVEKVGQLMALCDDLEARLQKSRADGEALMKAVVEHLVAAPGTSAEPMAMVG